MFLISNPKHSGVEGVARVDMGDAPIDTVREGLAYVRGILPAFRRPRPVLAWTLPVVGPQRTRRVRLCAYLLWRASAREERTVPH